MYVLICIPSALAATGMIWVRYSLVIIPVNYSLAAVSYAQHSLVLYDQYFKVNFFVGATGLGQLGRIAQ